MINNNVLANRLNLSRKGLPQPINNEESEEVNETLTSSDFDTVKDDKPDINPKIAINLLLNLIINGGVFCIISIIFGLSYNILTHSGYVFQELFILGLSFTIIAKGIYNIFTKKY